MENRRDFIRKVSAGAFGSGISLFYSGRTMAAFQNYLDKKVKSDKEIDFHEFRKHLLIPSNLIYLNTGSLGPSPKEVVDFIHEKMMTLEENPVSNMWGPLGEEMDRVRQKAAKFLGARKEEIVLTRNTTEGMNMSASGIDLKPGDEVLTTNHEHPGGMVCWEHAAKHRGIKIVKMEMPMPAKSKEQICDLVASHITPRTKVCSFSHVTTTTGLRMPIAEIAQITRPKGILLICDGAQASGMLKIDVSRLNADVYATSGHKWLCGPKGTGILYIRKEVQNLVKPAFLHSGYNSYTASSGTRDVASLIGLGMVLDLHRAFDPEAVEKRCLKLRNILYEKLQGVSGIRLLSSSNPQLASAMISVDLKQAKKKEVFEAMKKRDVIIKLLPKYNALRFSTHFFNHEQEISSMMNMFKGLV